MRFRKYILFVLKLLVSLLLVFLLLKSVSAHDIMLTLKEVNHFYFWYALLACVSTLLLSAIRWKVLMPEMSYWTCLKYTWIGVFFGMILPGGVSGDIAKGASLAIKNKSLRNVNMPASIVVDKCAGLFAVLLIFAVVCGIQMYACKDLLWLRFYRIGFGAGLSGVLFMLLLLSMASRGVLLSWVNWKWLKNGRQHLLDLESFVSKSRNVGNRIFVAIVVSGLVQFANIIQTYYLARAVGICLPFLSIVVFAVVLAALVMLPISFSGIGVRDWFAVNYFAAHGVQAGQSVAYAWLALAAYLIMAIVGLIFQLGELAAKRQAEGS